MMKILFLCTGNSCRSQIAEGFANEFHRNCIDAQSAGITKHGLNQRAVQVMAELGIDISRHHSKTVEELPDRSFDFVITVCGHANESCPIFPGNTKVIHVGFDDPPKLAAKENTEGEIIKHYRRVRDEIRGFVKCLPAFFAENYDNKKKR